MTRDEKLQALRLWQERMQTCESAVSEFIDLTQAGPESKLIDSIYRVMGLATRQCADLTGSDHGTLEAWWTEHDFGQKPMRARLAGEPMREIRTIDELAALLMGDEG